MILQNPYPKGKWFTVKVKGRPQKIFIQAYGTYDLSNISNEFDTSGLSSQQAIEKFFKNSTRQSILIPSNKRAVLNTVNQLGKNFYVTPSETLNMISVRVPSLPDNSQQDNVFIYNIGDFFVNNVGNVIITYDPSKTISAVKVGDIELEKGEGGFLGNTKDWYIPNVGVMPGNPKRFDVTSTYLSTVLQEAGNSIVLTAVFTDEDAENFTINCETYYQPAVIDTFYAFEISNPSDITANVTWNEAEAVTSIVDSNNYQLIQNTDYSVESNTITIFSGYLATFFTEASEESFVFNFEKGEGSTKTIKAIQEFSDGAVILGADDYFYNQPSIHPIVRYNSNYTVSNIKYGEVILQKGTSSIGGNNDWYVPIGMSLDYYQIAITPTFLSSYLTNSGDTITLSMHFYDANPVDFTIEADYYYQPASVGSFAGESTSAAWFDVENAENMVATITWNDATTLLSIVDGLSYSLVENSDYTLTGDTVTILSTYLSSVATPPSSILLDFNFDLGASFATSISTQNNSGGGGRLPG